MLLTRFKEKGTPGTEAIVLWFDLEGFSRFFTQPDVHLYAPQYLNVIFSSVQDLFGAKAPAWCKGPGAASPSKGLGIREPDFAKFMGDGGFYLWLASAENEPIPHHFKTALIDCLLQLRSSFDFITERAADAVPLPALPGQNRFGVTRGTVYGLYVDGSSEPVDYIGFAINLAARLQSYARDIGLVASARLGLKQDEVRQARLKKVRATKLKGFDSEWVLVDENDYTSLSAEVREGLFSEAARDRRASCHRAGVGLMPTWGRHCAPRISGQSVESRRPARESAEGRRFRRAFGRVANERAQKHRRFDHPPCEGFRSAISRIASTEPITRPASSRMVVLLSSIVVRLPSRVIKVPCAIPPPECRSSATNGRGGAGIVTGTI
jgi:class 3 adenylate cyclase